MFKFYFPFLLFLSFSLLDANAQKKKFKWPNKTKAAVCLTFDDGLDSHLDFAMPLLDSFNIKGSFYCTGYSASLKNRMEEWRESANNGHELGNHTLFHPCDGRTFNWVKPEYDLSTYTESQIRNELITASTLLTAVDAQTERTFAYTCSNYQIKEEASYVNVVRELFTAARCDGEMPNDMKDVDLHFMPSWQVEDNSAEEMINYVKQAKDKGTVAIIMFHNVGGGYLNVSTEAFSGLLHYLNQHKNDYWTATFKELTDYIRQHNKK